jgi:hypothetical protein
MKSSSTYPVLEVLAFPLLNTSIKLEVTKLVEIKTFPFAVELGRSLLASSYDGLDVFRAIETIKGECLSLNSERVSQGLRVFGSHNLLSAMLNDIEEFIF